MSHKTDLQGGTTYVMLVTMRDFNLRNSQRCPLGETIKIGCDMLERAHASEWHSARYDCKIACDDARAIRSTVGGDHAINDARLGVPRSQKVTFEVVELQHRP